jgi:hypothetical protein
VSIGGKLTATGVADWGADDGVNPHILLNQCRWKILRLSQGAKEMPVCFDQSDEQRNGSGDALLTTAAAIEKTPEFIVSYGEWGEFKLSLGRIVRRGKRSSIHHNESRINAFDGWNAVIVSVLISGDELRTKADATRANLLEKLDTRNSAPTVFDKIALATESAIPRSANSADDLVEFACDGWVLEKA